MTSQSHAPAHRCRAELRVGAHECLREIIANFNVIIIYEIVIQCQHTIFLQFFLSLNVENKSNHFDICIEKFQCMYYKNNINILIFL